MKNKFFSDEMITENDLEKEDFDITSTDSKLVSEIPPSTHMGKVYERLILAT